MATAIRGGPRTKSADRDDEGHTTYKVTYLVKSDDKLDGPAVVLATPGLPAPGAFYFLDNDSDAAAWCRFGASVKQVEARELWWDVEFTFSSKPLDRDKQKCSDFKVESPLLEPQKISGNFQKYTEEAVRDRYGRPITNSAWEQLRGPQVEFDRNRPQVKVEQNVAALQLDLVTPMVDTVNALPLWGLPRRTVKLSNFSWERQFHGACYLYYKRTFEFDVRFETFDRDLLDEGTKVLNGEWDTTSGEWVVRNIAGAAPSRHNPRHFIRFKDRQGENSRVILNGQGLPAGAMVSNTSFEGYFVSRFNANTNRALSNTDWWVPLANNFGLAGEPDVVDWDEAPAGAFYFRGQVVSSGIVQYLCLIDHRDVDIGNATYWQALAAPLADAGNYSTATTYAAGNYVVDVNKTTAVGSVHVEKYSESNFLLLGIPIQF